MHINPHLHWQNIPLLIWATSALILSSLKWPRICVKMRQRRRHLFRRQRFRSEVARIPWGAVAIVLALLCTAATSLLLPHIYEDIHPSIISLFSGNFPPWIRSARYYHDLLHAEDGKEEDCPMPHLPKHTGSLWCFFSFVKFSTPFKAYFYHFYWNTVTGSARNYCILWVTQNV